MKKMRGLGSAHVLLVALALTWIAAHFRCWPILQDRAKLDSVAQSAEASSREPE